MLKYIKNILWKFIEEKQLVRKLFYAKVFYRFFFLFNFFFPHKHEDDDYIYVLWRMTVTSKIDIKGWWEYEASKDDDGTVTVHKNR